MSDLTLTKTRFLDGVWEGLVLQTVGSDLMPSIAVTHQDRSVEGIELTASDVGWVLRIPIPSQAIADGVQTLLIVDTASDQCLDSIIFVAGDPLAEDIRAEIDLLRAELDMLKRAFRRHCLETT
jgi:hypothetical protein